MSRGRRHRGRVGLVLGAGGPVGHAYHAGVIQALEHSLGWDAREVDVVLGTSAGAQVGALLRAGLSGDDLAARASGAPLSESAHGIAKHFVRPDHRVPHPEEPRRYWPSAPRSVLTSLRRPDLRRPGHLLSALLPQGRVRLDAQSEGLRNLFGRDWPERDLWLTSVNLDSGERVVFGSPGAPEIDVGTAVTCSGSVPFVHAPVEWQGLRYVDGGVASATHLDVMAGKGLDLVLVSSPLSMFSLMRGLLRREVGALSRDTKVIALEPTGEALAAMGSNPMAAERAPFVAKVAYETTRRALEQEVAKGRFASVFDRLP
jgi:NTE family protein